MKTLADMGQAALEVEGLTANPGKVPEDIYQRALYELVIAPGETDERAEEMARMSSCTLVVRGLWRRLGVKHPRLEPPYKLGRAVEDVAEIALESGALLDFGAPILPGHVLIVSQPEHVLTVISAIPTIGPRDLIISIDGGIRDPDDARFYAIRRCKRRLSVFPGLGDGGHAALESFDASGRLTLRRTITHHIDTAKVFERFGPP